MNIYKANEIQDFLQRFESRRQDVSADVEHSVRHILQNVQEKGDRAVLDYTKKFDGVDLSELTVPQKELQQAFKNIDPGLLDVLRQAKQNIQKYHEKGLPQSWVSWEEDNVILGRRITAIERVGVYVPGGLAAYPSSLLMGVVPAQVAGVKDIYVTTPCAKDGSMNQTILAAAFELGTTRVYRMGGAQAIAAMAFGTETVARVDKIVGPGNIYVATAKKLLYGQCGIDMVAGPSEVLIIADDSADPEFVAADLLAQAEHDPLASSILVTDSETLAQKVADKVETQMKALQRSNIMQQAIRDYGGIIVTDSLLSCVELSNRLAPEHLGLHVDDPWTLLGQIKNAGAIFLGHYSPEAVGDYWAGPNHVLPTNGSARFFSPLQTEDFLKVSSIVSYTKQALDRHGKNIEKFAKNEGLDAHALAITKRMSS